MSTIIPFLRLDSAASLTGVNSHLRSSIFRNQVLSRVTKLSIEDEHQVNPAIGPSFPGVRKITFEGRVLLAFTNDALVQGPLIPFLGAFSGLQEINFSMDFMKVLIAIMLQVPEREGGPFNLDLYAQPVDRFLRLLGRAYETGTLPQRVRVVHPLCPYPHPEGAVCDLCRDVLAFFPPEHLIWFDPDQRRLMFALLDIPSYFAQVAGSGGPEGEAESRMGRNWPIHDDAVMRQFVQRPGGREAVFQCYVAMDVWQNYQTQYWEHDYFTNEWIPRIAHNVSFLPFDLVDQVSVIAALSAALSKHTFFR